MKTIVCFGDSNTHGYNPEDGGRFGKRVRWTGRLQQLLGEEYSVVAEGCNGRTIDQGDYVSGWINGRAYLRPCLYSHRDVDFLVVMLGTNDLKDSFAESAAEIAAAMDSFVEDAKVFMQEHQDTKMQMILIAPPILKEQIVNSVFGDEFSEASVAKSKELAAFYQKIAQKHGCAFLDASGFAEVSDDDCLHLSAENHEKFANELYQCIKALEQ